MKDLSASALDPMLEIKIDDFINRFTRLDDPGPDKK